MKTISNPAPVCIFTFKRFDTAFKTIEALKKNYLADQTDVYVFNDGPRGEHDMAGVTQVRDYLDKLTGFKSVKVIKREKNMGLSNSIIAGLTELFQTHSRMIVLEDDIESSPNFLAYMNQGLDKYENNLKVYNISSYTFPMNYPPDYKLQVYFTQRPSCWGWATWKNRWEQIDWEIKDYEEFKKNPQLIKAFNEGGSDMYSMLVRQVAGKIDSWDTIWAYNAFRLRQYTVYPISAKTQNIGFGNDATHTKFYNRFATTLDKTNQLEFDFPDEVVLHPKVVKAFKDKNSLFQRALGRLKFYLGFKNPDNF
jgi:hypothetical protein